MSAAIGVSRMRKAHGQKNADRDYTLGRKENSDQVFQYVTLLTQAAG
jgi:hypothetical protein